MTNTKPWYTSKAVWGGIVAAAAGVASLAGHELSPETQAFLADQAVAIATSVATIVGGVLAIYGRIKAETKIGKKG